MLRSAALCLALVASPLAAQDKSELCTVTSGILGTAITARLAGQKAPAAEKAIVKSLAGDKAAYQPAVAPIVERVYSLPEDQLNTGTAKAYEQACLGQ